MERARTILGDYSIPEIPPSPPAPGRSVFPCFKNEIPRVLLRYVIVNVSTKQLHLINSEIVTHLSLLIYLTLTSTV